MRQVRMRAGAAVVLRTLLATLLVASLLDKKNAILVRFVLLLLLEHDALAAHAVRIVGKAAPGTADFGLESTQTCVEQHKGRDTIERKAEHAGHEDSCPAWLIGAGWIPQELLDLAEGKRCGSHDHRSDSRGEQDTPGPVHGRRAAEQIASVQEHENRDARRDGPGRTLRSQREIGA